ncbi:glycosyltransferase family 4 protein [Chroococcus sp. FPU101]|uniref:glycosyltransferase family 4 protein n=1 Tax=Chroococcus sp. FPU101 TaxID=1974212 RepID=UPI001A8E5F90|nr:glycosyltransferase family 4 protein [Chroococcus sp. FPU101]GFE68469.1 glycosyl transferase group 1 [Chroococcus sp. FPU101]
MKILALSSIFPYPPTKGKSERRTYNFLKYLNENHSVTLVIQIEQDSRPELDHVRECVDDVIIFPKNTEKLSKFSQWQYFLQQATPFNLLEDYNPKIQSWLDEKIKTHQFDVITCEGSETAIYIPSHWQNILPTILNVHRSPYGISQHKINHHISEKQWTEPLNLPLLRRYEQKLYPKFSSIVTMTYEDRQALKTFDLEVPITTIPNGIDLILYPKRPTNQGGQRIVLMGAMDKPANIDAARFFSLEVFPHLRQRYPDATLEIVGLRLTPPVIELGQYAGITIVDEGVSIVEYLHWATVCVLPLRQGRGIKRKTVEALAVGIPVVASDIALQHLTVDGSDVPLCAMRANSVAEYVYALARLFEDAKLREKLSVNGRTLIEQEFSWEKRSQRYEQVLCQTYDKFTN